MSSLNTIAAHAGTVADTIRCCGCGAKDLLEFFNVRQTPIDVGIVWDSAAEASKASTGDIKLVYCRACGLAYNQLYDLAKLSFQPGYEVALNHSAAFREFINGVITRLTQRYGLHHKNIVEIGCGAGYFLKSLCKRGANHGIGIDPTVPNIGVERVGEGQVEFIRGFFNDAHVTLPCDFVCCLSVFEDVPTPVEFLRSVRQTLGGGSDKALYFEVFNAFRAFRAKETWSVHYEQCNYFSQRSLTGLFERNGFEVLHAGECYQEGQYLFVEAAPTASGRSADTPPADVEVPEEIAEFSRLHQRRMETWQQRLQEFAARGARVVLWGSGGKCISFANALPTQDIIDYIVDINPDRQGKFVPGTAQRIVPPEFLVNYKPDVIILTNVLYEREIREQVSQLGLECQYFVA